MKTILVLALDGMMDSSLALTLDTLRTAELFLERSGKPARTKMLTAGMRRVVRTGAGLRLEVDVTFRDALAQRPDWIILPGLGLITADAIASRGEQRDAREAVELLRRAPASCRIAASCSSVFLLAQTGLLDGREVTMTWWLAHLFRARHPEIALNEAKMLVRDGRFLTAGSAYAQLDLTLAIVTELMGANVAHLCSRYLLIDQRPSQARYMVHAHTQHVDETVLAAERWIDAHLAEPIRITELASKLAVSPKTLARRIEAAAGISPVKFVQRRRLIRASHLIETTKLSIEEVAARVGYQDSTALRKLVKREFGRTPAALRA